MMRRNFRPAEVFTIGQRVQWLNGTHWLDGEIAGPVDRDSLGYAFYPVRNLQGTRTVSKGLVVNGYCKHIRSAA